MEVRPCIFFKMYFVTITGMKKYLMLLWVCFLAVGGFSQQSSTDPLLLINPGRETFINFPSQTLPGKTVTFFLPEEKVPLMGRYPVVYVLGASPKDAPAAARFIEKSQPKALVVGVNLTEEDLADAGRLTRFFTQELIPYVDTNYPTFADDDHRALIAQGTPGGVAAFSLLYRRLLFSKVLLLQADPALLNAAVLPRNLRLIALGERETLADFQAKLELAHFKYGEHFVLKESNQTLPFEENPFSYWFAPAEKVQIKKLIWDISPKKLPLQGAVQVAISARLQNGEQYGFYPPSILISPPVLDWDAAQGRLAAISGAEPGRVKLTVKTSQKDFSTKITLKKQ